MDGILRVPDVTHMEDHSRSLNIISWDVER
jgi:hypothetical protein